MADPGQRHEENNAYQPENRGQDPSCFNFRQPRSDQRKRGYDQAETKLPYSTELRLKQNGPPRCRRESTLERQSTHARHFQPKPEESRKKCCYDTPSGKAEQPVFNLVGIAASNATSRSKYNEVEGEDSRKQNRRADMHCASDDELCREHCFRSAPVPNEQSGM